MRFVKIVLILVIFCSCTTKKTEPAITWLYGYGQVEKLNGRVKKLIEKRSANNQLMPFFAYTFDSKGDLIMIKDLHENGVDSTKYKTFYNNDDKKAEVIGLYVDKGKQVREIYMFDDFEHITKYIGNAIRSSPDTDRFIYDKFGDLTEHQFYLDKKRLWILKFKYIQDIKGVCNGIEQSYITWHDNFKIPTKDTIFYIAFDSHNNWLKKVQYGDTITRKITYY